MSSIPATNSTFMTIAGHVSRWRHMLVPLGILMLLGVLDRATCHPVLLDILLVSEHRVGGDHPPDNGLHAPGAGFQRMFPAILLGVTLMRLVLNVASTRLILNADSPSDPGERHARGRASDRILRDLRRGFIHRGGPHHLPDPGCRAVRGHYQGGDTRMSEVAARFTLDAMPGKQMAIDADLSAGLIDEEEARQRRNDVT